MAFNNTHRYFIQFMIHNGSVTEEQAVKFFATIQGNNSLIPLTDILVEINQKIQDLSFKISPAVCEVTCEKVLLWLNTNNDEISQTQPAFKPIEKEYFRAIMQEIVTSEQHFLTYAQAINIAATLTATLSREQGQNLLQLWMHESYFVQKDAFIYLGPRLIHEFSPYLRSNTNNCICNLCSELVFVGQNCSSCQKPFHKLCLERYFKKASVCPSCKDNWETEQIHYQEAGPSSR